MHSERLQTQQKKSQNRVGMALRTIAEGDIYEHEFTIVPKRRNLKMKRVSIIVIWTHSICSFFKKKMFLQCDVDQGADKDTGTSTKPSPKKRKTATKKETNKR